MRSYEPSCMEISDAIAASRGLCPHCRARVGDCDCEDETDFYEFAASSFPEEEDEQ